MGSSIDEVVDRLQLPCSRKNAARITIRLSRRLPCEPERPIVNAERNHRPPPNRARWPSDFGTALSGSVAAFSESRCCEFAATGARWSPEPVAGWWCRITRAISIRCCSAWRATGG